MTSTKCLQGTEYIKKLRNDPAEAAVLFQQLCAPHRTFFRSPARWVRLQKKIFPALLHNHPKNEPVRIWFPGCASGEEAYSTAICLFEFLEHQSPETSFVLFGTDSNQSLIGQAHNGSYPGSISSHVSPERLRRFFVKTESGYQVADFIRTRCVFAQQDFSREIPFSNMDYVDSSHILIGSESQGQDKAFSILYFSLRPGGILALGTANTPGSLADHFSLLDRKTGTFSKISAVWTPGNDASRSMAARQEGHTGQGPREHSGLPTVRRGGAAWSATNASELLLSNFMTSHPFSTGKTSPVDGGKNRAACKTRFPSPPRLTTPEMIRNKTRKISRGNAGSLTKIPRSQRKRFKSGKEADRYMARLQKDLMLAEKLLLVVMKEREDSNNKWMLANEELQSSNEEFQNINEEIRASKAELQASMRELSRLNSDLVNTFASTNIPIVILDQGLRVKRFTPAAFRILNIIETDIGRPITDIKLNIDLRDLEKRIRNVIKRGESRDIEVRDREGRWYLLSISPYVTVEKLPDGVVITMLDIDIIKKSQDTLQEALDYVETIVENIGDSILVLDQTLMIQSTNTSFLRSFVLEKPDVIGQRMHDLPYPQWKNALLWRSLEDLFSRNHRFENLEIVFEIPGVGNRIMSFNGHPIQDLKLKRQLALLVIKDISERKAAEMKLRATLDRYRLYIELSEQLAWTSDAKGMIIEDMPKWRHFTGQTTGEIMGEGLWNAFIPDDRESVLKAWKKAVASGTDFESQGRIRGRNDAVLNFLVRAAPVRDADGNVLEWIGVGIDITEITKAGEVLKRDKSSLEDLIQTRSRELLDSQNELQKARRLMDMGVLAATVAHELRNPLAAITMAIHNIRKKSRNKALIPHLNNISIKLSVSDQIINNLLFYSRVKLPVYKPVDIMKIISGCVETSRSQCHKKISLGTHLTPKGKRILIEADALQMSEVFNNLLNNACDAVPDKKARIDIGIVSGDENVVISIRDNGPGLDKDQIDKIFIPFFTTKSKGTGLGLAVCHQIVLLHNGSIKAESAPGQGMTIIVSLPRKRPAAPA
jgi:two-component system CheB/CheR fusion protein